MNPSDILNNILGFDFPKNTTKLDIISILVDLYQRHKLKKMIFR